MRRTLPIKIPETELRNFCRKNHIRKLALFGSVLRNDFREDSDIDVLVEFEAGHVPGLGFIRIQRELAALFSRKVDLNTPKFLSRHFREQVLQEAEVLYAQE